MTNLSACDTAFSSMTKLKLLDFLDLEPVGNRLADLNTPVPVVDIAIVERNVQRWQVRCDTLGIANRPHIKTHKIDGLARYQLAMGAAGITVQKLGEAEVMADHGISDMLLTFNVVGAPKLARLAVLMKRTAIAVVADNAAMLAGLAGAAQSANRRLRVLVECDTGGGRNGVQSPDAALQLALQINALDGLQFAGLMTYPRAGLRQPAQDFLRTAQRFIVAEGLSCDVITSGGTPDMWRDEGLEGISEYRAGTYVYNDRSQVVRNVCGFEDCALTVLSTVVSTPTADRVIIDAGTKALTSDLLGLTGYGVVGGNVSVVVKDANEEHGILDVSAAPGRYHVGDLVRIVPNHVCPVSNLFDRVVFVQGETVLGAVRVDARGRVD
jgi:D-serine deaminase-like pyridoxal phosphate-dependent protein